MLNCYSCVQLYGTLCTEARQAPCPWGFSRRLIIPSFKKKEYQKKKKKRIITELLKVHGISISLVKQESGSVHGFSGSESHGEVAAWQNQLQLPILSDHLTTLCQALG